ncbi:MAG: hypothetical protein H6721_34270 [Sandaracinus sp.]|nr:hypothetical protein [Sandaracinus sp.]MCB9637205.1 hypothetical protein [Sandaracinus sp.]
MSAALVAEIHARLEAHAGALRHVVLRGWEDEILDLPPRGIVDGFDLVLQGVLGAVHCRDGGRVSLDLIDFVGSNGYVVHPFGASHLAPRVLACGRAERASLFALGFRRSLAGWSRAVEDATTAIDVLERACDLAWRVLEPSDLPEGLAFPRSRGFHLPWLLEWDTIERDEARGIGRIAVDDETIEARWDDASVHVRRGTATWAYERDRFDEPFVRWLLTSKLGVERLRPLR